MPVKKLPRKIASPLAAELRAELLKEWRKPSNTGQPIILTEGGGKNPVHVYVVWEKWGELAQRERSEIIMDAYEAMFGLHKSLAVTVAMGMTPTEADRMGIRYQ